MGKPCHHLRMRGDRRHFAQGNFFLVVVPGQTGASGLQTNHGNAALYRADQCTEVAAHTRFFDDFGDWFAGHSSWSEPKSVRGDQSDCLMGSIFTGNVTKITPDTSIVVDPSNSLVV